MEDGPQKRLALDRVNEQIEKLQEIVEVEKAQSLLVFFDIQDFCFRKRRQDPSKSARTLADIEQHDKTVFYDAPVSPDSPRKKKPRIGPNDINPDYLNVNIDEESYNHSKTESRRSPLPNLILSNQVMRHSS
jgi:hypothetical protein